MHTVCRKTKANDFYDFAYDFIEATSKNIESRKDVCFDTYQNYSMKDATNGDLEAGDLSKQRCHFLETWVHFIQ